MKQFEKVDFSNPTEKMIQDAMKMGLDLKDERIRDALVEMQRRQLQGESISDITKDMESMSDKLNSTKQPKSYFHIIFPVMMAVFLYRMYSLGLLDWLAGYITGNHEGAVDEDEDFFGDW